MREIQSIRNRMGGEPTFRDRRLTINKILYCLANGQCICELAEEYGIEQACIEDALKDIADNIYDWMRPETTWELWEDQDNYRDVNSLTFSPSENITTMLNQGTMGNKPVRIWTVKAKSYIEASIKYHEYMKWEPYKPMLDENGNTHCEDEGDTI